MQTYSCDILIAGGGVGGCAAALSALQADASVCLTEECAWIGGQITAQGVSALDEHEWIESFGATRNYYRFRDAIRSYYKSRYRLGKSTPQDSEFNPGNCWVSRLAFEPRVGLLILHELLQPFLSSEQLRLFTHTRVTRLDRKDDTIRRAVALHQGYKKRIAFHASVFVDATELGDLLPLAGLPYLVGAEAQSETDEPHAPEKAEPESVQSFTFPFIVEFQSRGAFYIPSPRNYARNRRNQPYSLDNPRPDGSSQAFSMFQTLPGTPGSFWNYRRLIDSGQFRASAFPGDLSLINWHSNDYSAASLIDKTPRQKRKIIREAKELALGFLFWLQNEAPRDDGGRGYPELLLRKEQMGTADGLAQYPYIRESRRIQALRTIREQDISAETQKGARASFFADSCGIGKYWIDVHRTTAGQPGWFIETRPFQIPLGALIPQQPINLIASAKNIGTTHITNGAYRLHPVEWAIGEAAGSLASICSQTSLSPQEIYESYLSEIQKQLILNGSPLCWIIDVPYMHPHFAPVQMLAVSGVVPLSDDDLRFYPDQPISEYQAGEWSSRVRLTDESHPVYEKTASLSVMRCQARWPQLSGFLDRLPDLHHSTSRTELTRAQFASLLYAWMSSQKI
ncbi:FAD-dependent oxidoreductase [candidate division KSB1 bacterium]|nr:FAD-dependent oxidoreductase [candidate division KSB1 bacterium]